MSSIKELRVVQEDMGSGAVAFEEGDITWLFISPHQSWDYAVKSVMKACDRLTLQEVEAIIRAHCPKIREMNERLGVDHPPVPRFEAAAPPADVLPPVEKTGAHRKPRPPRWARIAAVAAPALVGGSLLAHFFAPAHAGESRGAPGITATQADAPSVFENPTFKEYVESGNLRCESVGQYAAKCVDEDGQVMLSEASVGDSAVFVFSYDSEKLGFRLFESASEASAWARESGNREIYDNLTVVGRVALWGTDKPRLKSWANSLTAHERQTQTMGGRAPLLASSPLGALPKRLAILALGTLGVPGEPAKGPAQGRSVHEVQTWRAVQLIMGVTDGYTDSRSGSGIADAVAVAADAVKPSTGVDWVPNGGLSTLPTTPPPAASTPPVAPPATTPAAPPASTEPAAPAAPTSPTAEPAPEQTTAPAADPIVKSAPESKPADANPPVTPPAPPAAPRADPPVTPPAPPAAPTADPAPEQPAAPAPEPVIETPAPAPVETPAETTPAPPVEEEPEEEGLSLGGLPAAWAA